MRLLLQILASVSEFEKETIRERTPSGIRAAQAAGKIVGRPRRVFRRDEVCSAPRPERFVLESDWKEGWDSNDDGPGFVPNRLYGNRRLREGSFYRQTQPNRRRQIVCSEMIICRPKPLLPLNATESNQHAVDYAGPV